MKTIYLAVEVPDVEWQRATDELYVSDSALTRRLEMVLGARFAAAVAPVRNAVMLKLGDAVTIRTALQIAAEVVEASGGDGSGVLNDPVDVAELAQAHTAVSASLDVIARHGG